MWLWTHSIFFFSSFSFTLSGGNKTNQTILFDDIAYNLIYENYFFLSTFNYFQRTAIRETTSEAMWRHWDENSWQKIHWSTNCILATEIGHAIVHLSVSSFQALHNISECHSRSVFARLHSSCGKSANVFTISWKRKKMCSSPKYCLFTLSMSQPTVCIVFITFLYFFLSLHYKSEKPLRVTKVFELRNFKLCIWKVGCAWFSLQWFQRKVTSENRTEVEKLWNLIINTAV